MLNTSRRTNDCDKAEEEPPVGHEGRQEARKSAQDGQERRCKVSLPKPPKGTKIYFKPVDDRMFIEFAIPKGSVGEHYHLFDFTDEWTEMLNEIQGLEDVLSGGAEVNPEENEPAYAKFERLAAKFIELKRPKAAEMALDGFLHETMSGPDEDVVEALRVYTALWTKLKEMKAELARNN